MRGERRLRWFGTNYDFAESDTIYQRATYICKMHKARVRANRYYWERFEKLAGQRGAESGGNGRDVG